MQSAFVADDVSNIIKESIDAVLQNQQYNEGKVGCSGATPSRQEACACTRAGARTLVLTAQQH